MKNIYKLFTGFFALVLIMDNALAEKCPAGCFCLNGGEYTVVGHDEKSWCTGNGYGYTARTLGSNEANFFACSTEILNDINFPKQEPQKPNERYYKLSEFSEVYFSSLGAYGFLKNGEFLSLSNCSGGSKMMDKIFRCPHTYPNSDEGAKSLYECYKYTYPNGGSTTLKEYYKPNSTSTSSGNGNAAVNYDIESMKTLVTNLQSLLSQATKAAQDLESALNKKTSGSNDIQSSLNNWAKANDNSKLLTAEMDASVMGLFGTETTQSNSSTSSSSSTATNTTTNTSTSNGSSKTNTTQKELDTDTKKKLTDILNKFKIKSATVPVERAAVYDAGRSYNAQESINNRQINNRAATVASESVGGRNARDASRGGVRAEARQSDSGRLAR